MGKGPSWSYDELAILSEGREAGLPCEEIAAKLPRRTPFAVKTKSAVMGYDTRQTYRRPVSAPRCLARRTPDPADVRLGAVMRAGWDRLMREGRPA